MAKRWAAASYVGVKGVLGTDHKIKKILFVCFETFILQYVNLQSCFAMLHSSPP